MARAGKKVLLVDADLRRPNIHGLFGLPNTRGLGWLLETISSDLCEEELANRVIDAIQEGPVANLSIIVAGISHANPSELLSSHLVPTLFDHWRSRFDLVLVDSPPMLAVTDPSTLAPRVDAVLLVVRSEDDNMSPAARAADMLATLGANVIGVIVNGIDEQGGKGYRIYSTNGSLLIGSGAVRNGAGYSYGSGNFSEYYGHPDGGDQPPPEDKHSAIAD
jgi:capsular exopolysaccharide synthesis family protein